MTEPELLFDLYLVRHAQSEGNAGMTPENSPAARQDPLLSANGLQQARALGERFSEMPLDAVFSSGLRRALQTAEQVILRQPPDGASTVEILPLLTECNTLEGYTGFSFAQLCQLVPCSVPAAFRQDATTVLPNNELEDSAYNITRAREALLYLFERFSSGEKVMVVAHGIINTLLLLQAIGVDVQRFDPDFDNAGVTLLSFFAPGTGQWGFDVRLRKLNDTSNEHFVCGRRTNG